jgi:hypothetical protein
MRVEYLKRALLTCNLTISKAPDRPILTNNIVHSFMRSIYVIFYPDPLILMLLGSIQNMNFISFPHDLQDI